jgi:hypothetical protein
MSGKEMGKTSKVEHDTACFTPTASTPAGETFAAATPSLCATFNHWASIMTSKAFVVDVLVPYFKSVIAPDKFGKQVCIFVIDVWYGWISPEFRDWMKTEYPWIRLIYVPACCTPSGQPLDKGLMALLKAKTRRMYNSWAGAYTRPLLSST